MPLRYVFDEHLRGRTWHAVQSHNRTGKYLLDAVRVGDPADLPLGADDTTILQWAERTQRILVSRDVHTIPDRLADHLSRGHHSPGVFMIRAGCTVPEVIAFLQDAAYSSESAEWQDRVEFIP
jgi:GAF domain-containing protein